MVTKAKGSGRPIMSEIDRCAMVKSLRSVDDAIIVYALENLHGISKDLNVDKVFKHEGFKRLKVYGVDNTRAELVIVPDIPGFISTTDIINRAVYSTHSAAQIKSFT
jgi:bifunctional ADP-heptose synthase (sugar kinase/adenylyltransferase)